MAGNDYYSVLGVLQSAEIIVIRAAYRALAKQYHPDTWSGDKFEADRRMRELNEAYSILSDEGKRKAYDTQRLNHAHSFDFDDDDPLAAFRNAEKAQETEWALAVEFYPDLVNLYQHLRKTSHKLAFAYRLALLERKDFKRRQEIAQAMEEAFLRHYFGNNKTILEFARSLIIKGNKAAARELNRVVKIMGSSTEPELIIGRVRQKFGLEEPLRELARTVNENRDANAAKQLIVMLGGTVRQKPAGTLVIILDRHLMLPKSFASEHELTDWVMKEISPKYT